MNKHLLFVLLLSILNNSFAQLGRYTKSGSQWWLGISSGINKTTASNVGANTYSVFVNEKDDILNKNYFNQGLTGSHLGVILTYDIYAGMAISFQPTLSAYKFGYTSTVEWTDSENPNNDFSLKQEHVNQLNYIQIPLYLKYDVLFSNFGSSGRDVFIPFVQIGGIYSLLNNASKTVTESGVSNGSEYNKTPNTINVTDQFIRSQIEISGGAGFNIDINNFRFALCFDYRLGLNNITSKPNRFSNSQQYLDYYDAYDDIKLKGWSLSLQAIFPLKFIYDPHFRKS